MRNADTESFLKRVEEYDLQRKNTAKPPVKDKPDYLSLERARRLLQGDSPPHRAEGSFERTDIDLVADELAYKSAYNYERSFSPEKARYQAAGSGSKTFVVSEEDYRLLQLLKSSSGDQLRVFENPVKKHYPSRGRPREIAHTSEEAPSLPARRAKSVSSSEEEVAPSSPIRKVKNVIDEAPALPTRRYREVEELRPKLSSEDNRNKPELPETKEQKKSAPPVPRKRNEVSKKVDVKPTTFITSLENNKLTAIPKVEVPLQPTPAPKAHTDYLDSVHLTPRSSDHTQSRPQKPLSPSVKGGSFINSALKTISPSPSHGDLKIDKPARPLKPAKLANLKTAEVKEPSHENEFSSVALKSTAKPKPQVPTKKEGLTIPRLRPVAPPPKRKPDIKNVAEDSLLNGLKKVDLGTANQQRVSTPPEALLKMNQLNKSARADGTAKGEKPVTEAQAKLRGLKSPPPVPQRKISMPEALKKAERLKSSKETPKETSSVPPKRDIRNDLHAILTASADPSPTSSSRPSLNSSKSSSTSSLVHPTKSRARGPKRKLPTKI